MAIRNSWSNENRTSFRFNLMRMFLKSLEGSKSRITFFPLAASGIAHCLMLHGGKVGKKIDIQEAQCSNGKTTKIGKILLKHTFTYLSAISCDIEGSLRRTMPS
jgi:hypothetical protein